MIQKLNFYEFVPRNNYNSVQRRSFKYAHFSGKVETKKAKNKANKQKAAPGPGDVIQWIRVPICKHEDPGACNSNTMGGRQENLWGLLPGFRKRRCLKHKAESDSTGDAVLFSGLCTHTSTNSHTHVSIHHTYTPQTHM